MKIKTKSEPTSNYKRHSCRPSLRHCQRMPWHTKPRHMQTPGANKNLSLSLFLQGEGGGKLQAVHPTQLTFKRSRAHNTPMCSDCVYTWSLLAQNQTEINLTSGCLVIDSHPCHRHEKHVQSSQGHTLSADDTSWIDGSSQSCRALHKLNHAELWKPGSW